MAVDEQPKLELANFLAQREGQGSPLFQTRQSRGSMFIVYLLHFRGDAAAVRNTTHSNYFQFYNDAILGIGELPLKLSNYLPLLCRTMQHSRLEDSSGWLLMDTLFSIQ